LRYTEDSKSYTYSRIDPTTGMPAFFVGGLNGFTGDYPQQGGYAGRTDYRIDVDYRWAPELMTYVEASTGFKGGGVNPRPFFISQALPFGPEDLTAFEAGFKSNLFDNSLQMNGAAFYNQYHDIQLTLLTCPFAPYTPCALPANVANAHIKGLELETIAHPYPGLSIDSTVSYLDFHYTGFAENVGVTNGMVAPFTNKFKASFGVQYAADLGEHGTFTPRVDWSYQSSFFTNAVNSEFNKVGARGLVNLKATYTSENGLWSVTGGVTNLFDKFYYLNKFDLSAAFGVVSGQPGAPREWTIGVVRRF
jgi:iron complex outermembrane receptor protein